MSWKECNLTLAVSWSPKENGLVSIALIIIYYFFNNFFAYYATTWIETPLIFVIAVAFIQGSFVFTASVVSSEIFCPTYKCINDLNN